MSGKESACDVGALPRRRIDAIKSGSARYYTGVPCSKGHVEWRNTANGSCRRCTAIKRRLFDAKKIATPELIAKRWHAALPHEEKLRERRLKARQKAVDDPIGRWVSVAVRASKQRARDKGLPHNITIDYLYSICVETCPALGVKLVYSNAGHQIATSANLDRIKPDLGYVVGNVRVISKRANCVRNDATFDEFKMIYEWLLAQEGE